MGSIEQTFDAVRALQDYGVDVQDVLKEGSSVASALTSLYPKQIVQTSDYAEWSKGLWSMHQRASKPSIIFQPKSAKEVAITVLLCRHTQTKFAVKSGGHAAMEGASNSLNGVTIDLKNFTGVEVSEDKSIARLGAGGQWEEIYKVLEKDNVSVAGGRAGDVGIGGYTLGGGISFFASAQGWGCDTVRNYELVTAEGQIINVTRESYPDLFWALRGGGTNFGIVTRFDYETFPLYDIFAGSVLVDGAEYKNEAIAAFSTYAHNADPKAATWFSIAYAQERKLISALAMYADPNPDAAFLKPYLSIKNLHSSVKIRSIADMTHEVAEVNVKHHRQNYNNTTYKFDPDFVAWMGDMYWEYIAQQPAYDGDQGNVLLLQIYTKETVRNMQRNGGNCLGLKEEDAPYLNVLTPVAWLKEEDDERIFDMIEEIKNRIVAEGKKRGLYVPFIYMNYASKFQDVLAGYGKENYDRLQSVAKKYDPEGVFQTLMPGYFKFGGAPASRK